jgi:hypothetical protein
MDLEVVALSAVIGFAAGSIWVHTQNPYAGIAAVGIGVVGLLGLSAISGGTSVIGSFVELVGLGGLVAAIVGGMAGAYVADRARSEQNQ